jgi:tyrosyl-DNA phosphodiesterase 2
MNDAIVPIRAIWFASSGQWEYAPLAPYDSKATYASDSLPTSLALVTWNVDFAAPHPKPRLQSALDYLQFHAFPEFKGGQPPPCLILLQEIKADAFDTLLAHPWIRAWFMIVPGSGEDGWPRYAGYGTVTLVARSAPLSGSICVHFGESRMWRNALVTDVVLGGAEPHARVVRVVNTHLESLPEGTPRRVVQMKVIAGLLKDASVSDGIVCGDMNAIAPSDETIAEANGLLDAWEQRQDADEDDGMTWGYQPRCRFPPGRLDKILHTPCKSVKIKDVRRLAVGLEMPSGGWVSDHYGLACQVEAQDVASLEAEGGKE